MGQERSPWRLTTFDLDFRADLRYWLGVDRKTALRILERVAATVREPFGDLGKPEPLTHPGPGLWSRRITQEHRLVYRVSSERIDFLQPRYHY